MLNFERAKNVDYVPSKLADSAIYDKLPQGAWVLPESVTTDGTVLYSVPATIDPAADAAAVRNARISFSEQGLLDVKELGEITSLRGVLTLETDQFITSEGFAMNIGTELTLKVDSDKVIKLGVAGATDVVKGVVEVPPASNPDSHLVFHATLY